MRRCPNGASTRVCAGGSTEDIGDFPKRQASLQNKVRRSALCAVTTSSALSASESRAPAIELFKFSCWAFFKVYRKKYRDRERCPVAAAFGFAAAYTCPFRFRVCRL